MGGGRLRDWEREMIKNSLIPLWRLTSSQVTGDPEKSMYSSCLNTGRLETKESQCYSSNARRKKPMSQVEGNQAGKVPFYWQEGPPFCCI